MQPPITEVSPEVMEAIRQDAIAMLIDEGGPASLAGILWTPGSIQLAAIAVQVRALLLDTTLVLAISAAVHVLPGVASVVVPSLAWLLFPVLWRLYGRTPGMAVLGLYVVHLTRDDLVHPSVLRGVARVLLLVLTAPLVPVSRAGQAAAAPPSSLPILPADRLLDMRVFRYRLCAPRGRTRGDRVLDRLGVFARRTT